MEKAKLRRFSKYLLLCVTLIVLICLLRLYIQQDKKFPIVTYGDSITQLNTWQPDLEDYLGENILNLGIGSSCVCSNASKFVVLDSENKEIARDCGFIGLAGRTFYKAFRDFDMTRFVQHRIPTSNFSSDIRLATIPKEAKLIFIMGGTNDAGTKCTMKEYYSAYQHIINYIHKNIPEAKIVIMPPIHNQEEYYDKDGQSHLPHKARMDSIRATTRQIANDNKLQFINVTECGIDSLNIDKYTIDGVHPNREGGKLISAYIISHYK